MDKRTNTTLTFGYDNIYQLLTAKQGSTTKESYTYDLVGNRLSSLGVSPYNYNSSNELTSLPSGSYSYDKNGNTQTKPDGTQYTWDINNELTQVVLPGTGGTVNFLYDPFGRRIQKSFTQNGTTATTDYLYDEDDLIESVNSNGNLIARYTQGYGFDQPLEVVQGGVASYYEADGLGSISSLSNSAGALANTYSYDSYGKLLASSGSVTNPFQFTGREFDPETGIYDYRNRFYDESVGRFVSEDPIGFGGGIDFYAYARNNPVRWIDPFGLEVQECRRPLFHQPIFNSWPPHTLLYSTQSGAGYGLGPDPLFLPSSFFGPVPGQIENENPYNPDGKIKPNYQCQKVSDNQCFENCVNRRRIQDTENPPGYWLGTYQCDNYANDIERQCTRECRQ